ncbi:MAG: PepSY-like domain-containing protein [Bacteroidota bacterium]
MKNFFLVAIAALSLSFFNSCSKSDQDLSDAALIAEISTSSEKISVEPADLPQDIVQVVEDDYFETYIETASRVDAKGYEVELGSGDRLYCNMDGNELRAEDGRFRGRPHRAGPCGFGRRVDVADLPAAITDYVAANYPDAEIRRAKTKGDVYIVAVTAPAILVFDLEGNFVEETHGFRHCRLWGEPIEIEDLSGTITEYITANYPDAELKKAANLRNGNIVVGVLLGDDRKILVFDQDGNFLFERG